MTPTVLYGSGCWTMTVDRARKLGVAQRRMLRKIVQTPRRRAEICPTAADQSENLGDQHLVKEDWQTWIVRATRDVEKHCSLANVEDWALAQRRKYWRWAGHVARISDGRWTSQLLHWIPWKGRRSRGRPLKRWAEELDKFVKSMGFDDASWDKLMQERDFWKNMEDNFVQSSPRKENGEKA